jgi:hypothetical protein
MSLKRWQFRRQREPMNGDSVGWPERSWGHLVRVYLGIALGLCAGSWAIGRVLQVQFDRVFLVVGGLLTLGGGWLRPWWFWEHPKALFLRRILGDTGAALVYTILGSGMVYLGFFTAVRIVR